MKKPAQAAPAFFVFGGHRPLLLDVITRERG
jgi:hypothetical protein